MGATSHARGLGYGHPLRTTSACEPQDPDAEPLVRAMAGLAVELGWLRWVAVLLGMFFFLCRPGELLQARRRDLLTPGEALDENSGWLYLRNTNRRAGRIG